MGMVAKGVGTKICPFGEELVKTAEALALRIEGRRLPDDFDPGDMWYNQVVAHVRHEYTNYEELLWELPPCVDYWDQAQENRELCGHDYEEGECRWCEEAHDLLKRAASDVARALLSERR